jgi:hypothetical protein
MDNKWRKLIGCWLICLLGSASFGEQVVAGRLKLRIYGLAEKLIGCWLICERKHRILLLLDLASSNSIIGETMIKELQQEVTHAATTRVVSNGCLDTRPLSRCLHRQFIWTCHKDLPSWPRLDRDPKHSESNRWRPPVQNINIFRPQHKASWAAHFVPNGPSQMWIIAIQYRVKSFSPRRINMNDHMGTKGVFPRLFRLHVWASLGVSRSVASCRLQARLFSWKGSPCSSPGVLRYSVPSTLPLSR